MTYTDLGPFSVSSGIIVSPKDANAEQLIVLKTAHGALVRFYREALPLVTIADYEIDGATLLEAIDRVSEMCSHQKQWNGEQAASNSLLSGVYARLAATQQEAQKAFLGTEAEADTEHEIQRHLDLSRERSTVAAVYQENAATAERRLELLAEAKRRLKTFVAVVSADLVELNGKLSTTMKNLERASKRAHKLGKELDEQKHAARAFPMSSAAIAKVIARTEERLGQRWKWVFRYQEKLVEIMSQIRLLTRIRDGIRRPAPLLALAVALDLSGSMGGHEMSHDWF
ncbi:MAG TPA: hypothetical protein V6D17_14025 [Candidatus Obscuribacterales bacterium]